MTRLRKLLVMRRDFVANVSHELRTPVTAIQGYAETLLRGPVDDVDAQREFLEIIHRHARRLGALVEGLLTLSDLEARPPEQAVRERVDVAAIAEHVRATLRERAAQRAARIEVDVGDRRVVARGDPVGRRAGHREPRRQRDQVRQGLGGRGPRRRRVAATTAWSSRCTTTAPASAPSTCRGSSSASTASTPGRSRERGGTGLGLAIVKHLVESMGGMVDVTSAAATGTTFRVELPAFVSRGSVDLQLSGCADLCTSSEFSSASSSAPMTSPTVTE